MKAEFDKYEDMKINDIWNRKRAMKEDLKDIDYEGNEPFDKEGLRFQLVAGFIIDSKYDEDPVKHFTESIKEFEIFLIRNKVSYDRAEIPRFINDMTTNRNNRKRE